MEGLCQANLGKLVYAIYQTIRKGYVFRIVHFAKEWLNQAVYSHALHRNKYPALYPAHICQSFYMHYGFPDNPRAHSIERFLNQSSPYIPAASRSAPHEKTGCCLMPLKSSVTLHSILR